MEHIKAILIKFIATIVLLFIILGLFYNMAFRDIFFISLVLGVAAYILGDLIILPRTNNTVATISDFILAVVIIWAMSNALGYDGNLFTMSLISSIVVGVFEFFFHRYLLKNVLHDDERRRENKNQNRPRNLQYQTESAEEIYPITPDKDRTSDDS